MMGACPSQVLAAIVLKNSFSLPAMISFSGAGGKTSALYSLAEGLLKAGQTVLVTTTTKLYHPKFEGKSSYPVFVGSVETILSELDSNPSGIVVAAKSYDATTSKLSGYSREELQEIAKERNRDFILVEADGAQRKSIKAPAAHEPVIPEETALVFGVVGLDSLGKRLNDDHVHRADQFSNCTGLALGEEITASTIVNLVFQERGLFKQAPASCKKWVILNKADNDALKAEGEALAEAVIKRNQRHHLLEGVLVTSLKHPKYLKEYEVV